MPEIDIDKYPARKLRLYEAAYDRLLKIVMSDRPDAYAFRRALEAALAEGFPIDWPNRGWTLLHEAATDSTGIRAGLPQILIAAGADVNIKTKYGETPFSLVCRLFQLEGGAECLAVVNALLEAGAKPEFCENWIWITEEDQLARRRQLETYINSWPERRARDRARDTAPAFDYAL